MLICPVCRSQNQDSAKFCGNCGNPFIPQNESTSSLINCAQGHIYSAVYQYCPYCPQPDNSEPIDFATRVEDAPTALPQRDTGGQPMMDFSTRVDSGETVFETTETPAPAISPQMPPTEMISPQSAFEELIPGASSADRPTEVEPAPFVVEKAEAKFEEPPVEAHAAPSDRTVYAAPPAPPPPEPISRNTILAAQPEDADQSTKGKIVGWLITYTNAPDGRDYHIYSGYNRLGANPVCDIIIDDETVSGSHAIIVFREGRCLIKDDLSRNGTFVNGREITEAHPLQNYDQIRVGNTFLTFVSANKI